MKYRLAIFSSKPTYFLRWSSVSLRMIIGWQTDIVYCVINTWYVSNDQRRVGVNNPLVFSIEIRYFPGGHQQETRYSVTNTSCDAWHHIQPFVFNNLKCSFTMVQIGLPVHNIGAWMILFPMCVSSLNIDDIYSIRVPGWVLKCLNLITAPGSVSNQPGSVTWLATAGISKIHAVSWRNHIENQTTKGAQNM